MAEPVYQRILLKLSGEALKGSAEFGVTADAVLDLAAQIKEICELGVQVALVLGGGNIFRGVQGSRAGIERVTADQMGMLGTVINALAMQDALESIGQPTRVQTAIEMRSIAEPFIRRRAIRHLEKSRVVIFAAGTGNPFFTTDTTAALRASEIGAEAVLKGTKVDGVYSADPVHDPDAVRYEKLSYHRALRERLKVMDTTAFSMCMDNDLPIVVFNFRRPGNLLNVVSGDFVHASLVGHED